MELKLQNGDYVPDGRGGFATVTGTKETLQRVLSKLQTPRGALPMMPTFGSGLRACLRAKRGRQAAAVRAAVAEALRDEEDLTVERAELLREGEKLKLVLQMTCAGESLGAEVEVDGLEDD